MISARMVNSRNINSERKRHINSFHINFLCRPSAPLGQTRVCPRDKPGCKIRRQPGFVPDFYWICPRDKPGEMPGTNPGSCQDQPDKKVYVYVPVSCLNIAFGPHTRPHFGPQKRAYVRHPLTERMQRKMHMPWSTKLFDGAGTTPIPIKWGNSDQNSDHGEFKPPEFKSTVNL